MGHNSVNWAMSDALGGMTWQQFPYHWPLCGEYHAGGHRLTVDYSHQGSIMRGLVFAGSKPEQTFEHVMTWDAKRLMWRQNDPYLSCNGMSRRRTILTHILVERAPVQFAPNNFNTCKCLIAHPWGGCRCCVVPVLRYVKLPICTQLQLS